MAFDQLTGNVIGEIRQMAAQLEQLHRENTRMRNALQQIADMDPEGRRADDLGRAARVAREAQRPAGVTPAAPARVRPKACTADCRWPECTCGVLATGGLAPDVRGLVGERPSEETSPPWPRPSGVAEVRRTEYTPGGLPMTVVETRPAAGVTAAPAPSSEPAPPHSLPDWYECQRILDNAEFRKRAAAGLEGSVLDTPPTSPEPTELHRFIYEYDDADPYRSAWFMHRLELVLAEARTLGVDVPAQGNTTCNPHPDAPHGFNRNASHNAGRYVCDCEGWMPDGVSGSDHQTFSRQSPMEGSDGG